MTCYTILMYESFSIVGKTIYFNEMSLTFWSCIHLKDRIKLLCCSEIEIQRIYHKLENHGSVTFSENRMSFSESQEVDDVIP